MSIEQVRQYAASESELFKLMIQEDEPTFRDRMKRAGEFVFGNHDSPILLDDGIMREFSLGSQTERKPNSHLSLLAMVDAWHQLGVNPYKNLICQTPLFRLRLGIAEYLFRNQELLEAPFNVLANDSFHKISGKIREEIGLPLGKRVFPDWQKWLNEEVKKKKI